MLTIKQISKKYKNSNGVDTVALNNVSLSFPKTGMYAILGPSGSGKSTLLSLIGGLDIPSSGEILFNGININSLNEKELDNYRKQYISFIFQDHNLIEYLSLKENVLLKAKNKEGIEALLSKLQIDNLANKLPSKLSGGEKERAAITRSLMSESQILLCDEPTSSLDKDNANKVMEILKEISKEKLVLVVSHDQELCEKYTDNIIHIRNGEVQQNVTQDNNDTENNLEIRNSKIRTYKSSAFLRALKHIKHNLKSTCLMSILTTIAFYSASNIIGLAEGSKILINDTTTLLANYSPLNITSYYQNIGSLMLFEEPMILNDDSDSITVAEEQNIVSSLHKNIIKSEFVSYLVNNKKDDVNIIVDGDHSYSLIYEKNGSYNLFDEQRRDSLNDYLQTFLGKKNTVYSLNYNENDFKKQYNWIDGRYPLNDNEAIVVLSAGNVMIDSVAEILNVKEGDSPKTLINKTFGIASHKDIYIESDSESVTGYFLKSNEQLKGEGKDVREINYHLIKYVNDYYEGNIEELELDKKAIKSLFNSVEETRTLKAYAKIQNSSLLEEIYNNTSKTEKIKIVGVASTKSGSLFEQGNAGIMIPNHLLETVRQRNSLSPVANEIDKHIVMGEGELPYLMGYLNTVYDYSSSSLYEFIFNLVDFFENRKFFSTNGEINSIQIRTDNKDSREYMSQLIAKYNEDKEEKNTIREYDLTKRIIQTIDDTFGIVSDILYAISFITVLISGTMSLILIFNMIASRKKEVGIYRSSGYSRGYIFSLFEIESVFIGFVSGLVGLGLAVLTAPIISKTLISRGSSLFENVLRITPTWGLIIVATSIVVSFLAALVPSLIYSNKKPMDALR